MTKIKYLNINNRRYLLQTETLDFRIADPK